MDAGSESTVGLNLDKISVILLDVAGTTTSTGFVEVKMFDLRAAPSVRQFAGSFFRALLR